MALRHTRGKFNVDAVNPSKVAAVGFFPHQHYANGMPVAYVAATQEFGSSSHNIPPRSFMRTTIIEKYAELSKLITDAIMNIVSGKQSQEEALLSAGLMAAGFASVKITEIFEPELSAETIAARRRKKKTGNISTKPLIDTSKMFQSLTAQVVNKGDLQ